MVTSQKEIYTYIYTIYNVIYMIYIYIYNRATPRRMPAMVTTMQTRKNQTRTTVQVQYSIPTQEKKRGWGRPQEITHTHKKGMHHHGRFSVFVQPRHPTPPTFNFVEWCDFENLKNMHTTKPGENFRCCGTYSSDSLTGTRRQCRAPKDKCADCVRFFWSTTYKECVTCQV